MIPAPVGEWTRLPPLPDPVGVAGPFAGVSRGALLVAGGANFPGKKPWEGGKKVWSDRVFVLETPGGEWKAAGTLPRPLGYGVAVTHGAGVVCVGGSDANKHYADVFRLEWQGGRLVTTPLTPLPRPLANACGALVGDKFHVVGGIEKPDATEAGTAGWVLDLAADRPEWRPLPPCPGPGRMLAVAAGFDGAFWVVGGVELAAGAGGNVERRYRKDAYRFAPGSGWKRLADLPGPLAAGPSPAPSDAAGFYLLGGDDGTQVAAAPDRHRGFSPVMLRYDTKAGAWADAGRLPAPRATVPVAYWNRMWVVPSGEVRPGVRSPDVWAFGPRPKE